MDDVGQDCHVEVCEGFLGRWRGRESKAWSWIVCFRIWVDSTRSDSWHVARSGRSKRFCGLFVLWSPRGVFGCRFWWREVFSSKLTAELVELVEWSEMTKIPFLLAERNGDSTLFFLSENAKSGVKWQKYPCYWKYQKKYPCSNNITRKEKCNLIMWS